MSQKTLVKPAWVWKQLTHEAGARQVLGCPNHAGDFCAAKVDASEAVEIAGATLRVLFILVGVCDHGNGSINVIIDTRLL